MLFWTDDTLLAKIIIITSFGIFLPLGVGGGLATPDLVFLKGLES